MVNHSKFGMIHQPRTRHEKVSHLKVLGSVPLEMIDALAELNQERSGRNSKRSDPISHILMGLTPDPSSELIDSFCKACAKSEFDQSVWSILFSRTEELLNSLTRRDCAIILKCLTKFESTVDGKEVGSLPKQLLARLCSPNASGKELGFYSILYGIQALNEFGYTLEKKTNIRYFNSLLRNMRSSSAPFEVLVGLVQAISVRDPMPSSPILAPHLEEVNNRVSSLEMEPDTLFGLVSAIARLPMSDESLRVLTSCRSILMSPEKDELITAFSLEQLSGLAHAFSRMGPAVTSGSISLFTKLGAELARCSAWTPRTLAVTINAFGTAAVCHTDMLLSMQRIHSSVVAKLDTAQTAMVVYGLSRLGVLSDFPSVIQRAQSLAGSFDIHSSSKIVAALGAAELNTTEHMNQLLHLVRNKAQLTGPEVDSVLLTLHSAKPALSTLNREMMDVLLEVVDNHSGSTDISKLASLMHAYSSVKSDMVVNLCRGVLRRLVKEKGEMEITLADLGKILHALSGRVEISHDISETLRMYLVRRAYEIQSLGYRPLTRLGASMARCGIYDEDFLAAIDQRLLALSK